MRALKKSAHSRHWSKRVGFYTTMYPQKYDNRKIIYMLLLLLSLCRSDDSAALESYLKRVIPKVLYFEKLNKVLSLDVFVTKYGQTITATCTVGKRKISADVITSDTDYEITWAEADDQNGWRYERPTGDDEGAAMHYMEQLVNSVDPPTLTRVTSHRVKTISGETHHQMTLITELYGRKSLQFLEWKFLRDEPDKHTFVAHNVIVRDGEVI